MRFLAILAIFSGSLSSCSSVRLDTQERPLYHLNHAGKAHKAFHVQFIREIK